MNKNNFKIIDFAKGQVLPVFSENRNKEWVNYGDNNLYPDYLLDVYNHKSTLHKTIISKKVDMTAGGGFIEPTTEEAKIAILNNFSIYDLNETAIKLSQDLEIFGGFSFYVKWSMDGSTVLGIDYIPFNKSRLEISEKNIFLSKDWSNYRRNVNIPREYTRYNPRTASVEALNGSLDDHVYWYANITPGVDFYPLPAYSAALSYMELDWEIGNFHLSSVRNGFMPAFQLSFTDGKPTNDEMDTITRSIEQKFEGTENAGKLLVSWSIDKDSIPIITPIELSSSDERFLMLDEQVQSKTLIAHGITNPLLVGIKTPGQLGGSDEQLESLQIFNSTYIKTKQSIIEKHINKALNIDEDLKLKEYEIDFGKIDKDITPEQDKNTETE